ncbi:MAG: DUF2892 domain-containing protein [Bacteroidales bacterium]|nr:DUF2892 domain-containing protein [Bacteroidales bacterium]MBK9356046.1 DUF2892 domain-containing protein [Bacteroidales bacterium]
MKKNIGNTDKLIRLVVALAIAILYFADLISGTLAIILGVVALAMVATSLMSYCGLYSIIGFTSCKNKTAKE